MRLLTNPSCLDGGGQCAQIRRRREVGEIVFLLPGGTLLANEPSFVAREMLLTFIPYPLRRAVGGADTESSKSRFQATFRPAAPTHGFPFGAGQHLFCRNRQDIWYVVLSWLPADFGNRPNELHINRIHLEVPRDADSPGQSALC